MKFYFVLLVQLFLIYSFSLSQHRVRTVCIDAGHGGRDPGVTYGRFKEKDLTLKIAKQLGRKIKARYPKVRVYYTRLSDKFVGLGTRAKIANRNNADLFISIHINSNRKPSSHGSMSIIWGKSKRGARIYGAINEVMKQTIANESCKEDIDSNNEMAKFHTFIAKSLSKREQFAALCEERLKHETSRYSYGVKHANFAVLRLTDMPAVLIEVGFITNYADRKYITSSKGQQAISTAIFHAFEDYKEGKRGNFFIQIAASKIYDKKDFAHFKNLQIRYRNGWYKYVLTGFASKGQAKKRLRQIQRIPKYRKAFIIKAF